MKKRKSETEVATETTSDIFYEIFSSECPTFRHLPNSGVVFNHLDFPTWTYPVAGLALERPPTQFIFEAPTKYFRYHYSMNSCFYYSNGICFKMISRREAQNGHF